ncbi:tripartite tricarboxylate transporter substrate binding protein [Falsiroseomonas stagni]|uniref:Tripartite-type tricarboxylate transporter, receptor component TctC n=1 Tax=Falsiroseomonas stagni DSM 19981 TaxID=1123062 RepID=A0A1I3Y3C5_9PROT|nr:tripartite tricarboxylate transporter substrate binding protein [Falsiroseomonas stagni]SFK25909.1 Tripartite-type tricarboxylate transporter, receptor component TctC [Falsiroseomonas stagni DSM 19981]
MIHQIGRRTALGLGATLLATPALRAQGRFPDRPIRLIVPWAAGGTTDIQMRVLAEQAARRLGQPVIVENRGGAGGVLGAQQMLNERNDGYVITQMPISVFRHPQMASRPLFNPLEDFTYIIHLTGYLFGVVVKPDAPWNTFQEFLDHAKANPGRVTYGTPGVGTSLHITMEQIAGARGIDWVHVPFRGFAENVTSLLAGQTTALADSSGWSEMVQAGRLKLLVTWSADRAKRFPNVPTLRETGIDIVSASPYGLAGPKGMNPDVVRALHDAFKEALYDPAHMAILDRFDMAPMYLGPDDYATDARRTFATEGEMIRKLGLRL